jgi:DNA invertase Pin-like site-specific DNA recombinase
MHELSSRGIDLKVLTGQGAAIDTTTTAGRLVYGIFASLAEFERNMINERLVNGPPLSRVRGRNGGRKPKMTPEQLRSAMAALGSPETKVDQLCRELGVTLSTLYRYVSPTGELRE